MICRQYIDSIYNEPNQHLLYRSDWHYLLHLSTVHSLQRIAGHLLAIISPNRILTWDGAVITVDTVSSVVPEEECKHTRSSSKNSQLRVFLECPNKPSPLCLQFQTDGNPAICPASISLSGLPRGHSEAERVGGVF